MANNVNRRPSGSNSTPFQDSAPRSRVLFEYNIPDEDGLHSEVTQEFGSLRSIGVQLLSPLQEKAAAAAAKGDGIQLAFELARRSIAEVTNSEDEVHQIRQADTSSDRLWGQMHPKIRSLVVQAYSENAAPSESASTSFLSSRKIKA